MLTAILKGKRRGTGVDERALAHDVEAYEDTLTATLFERLLYLPDDVVIAVLSDPSFWPGEGFQPSGPVEDVWFWPCWPAPDGRPDRERIEPDVVIDFPGHRLVIEAKRFDLADQQLPEQLALEWLAAQGERKVWLLTVGGLADSRKTTFAAKRAEMVDQLAALGCEAPSEVRLGHASWADLFQTIGARAGDRPEARRVVADLEAGLAMHRVRTQRAGWLADLAICAARPITATPVDFQPMSLARTLARLGGIATSPSVFSPGK